MAATSASSFISLLLISSLLLASFSSFTEAQNPPVAKGLSWTFYDKSCPKLESIVRKQIQNALKKDIGLAAGLIRIHFHDCFVQGCDGSVLLEGSTGEQNAPPNQSLRKEALKLVDDLRARVHEECGRVVSCTDILAVAARDSVVLSGGPNYNVPLGRRDSTTFATVVKLPSPFSNTTVILQDFQEKSFNARETVALSGGHTIGLAHCPSFTSRLYPKQDTTLDKTFANNLKKTCPTSNSNNTTVFDIRSPNVFDNKYYVDLMNRQGLLTSDQDLYTDKRTRDIVTSFAVNQSLFFQEFANSMIKMSQLSVLTGNQGEIRAKCSVKNSNNLASVVEDVLEEAWSEII